jgi:YidC/Oxa1 family membrane protein insertase
MMPIQIKTVRQSENMKKMQPEMAKIEKKYKDKTDNESLMAKSQETMMLYKKYNINPLSSCLLAFIQLPIFFAFLEAINRVPAIFEGTFLGMNLGMTPGTGISQGNYIYIILIILIIGTTYLSFNNAMKQQPTTNNEMAQQTKMMSMFMLFTVSIASFSLPTAIALYWIVTNGFAFVQNFIIKKLIEKRN